MDYRSCSCHEKADWELGDWEDYWCLIANQPLVCQRMEGRTAVLLRGDPEQAAVFQPVRLDAQQSYTHKHNLAHCLSVTACYDTHTHTDGYGSVMTPSRQKHTPIMKYESN